MRANEILYPLGADVPQHELEQHKQTWNTIQKQLIDLKGESINFKELLVKLRIAENNYGLSVRSAQKFSYYIFKKRTEDK